MMQLQSPQLLVGFLLAIFGTALFSLKSIFIKLAYAQGLNTDSVLMLRMAISLPIYLGIIIWLIRYKPIHRNELKNRFVSILVLGFMGYFLSSWLDLKGLEYITAQLERLTLFTYPIITAILGAIFFKTPLTRKVIFSLIITYTGLWVVFIEELDVFGNETIWGTLFVFLAALSFSIYVLFGKQVITAIGSLWFTSLAMTASSLFVLAYYFTFFDFSALTTTEEAWLWLFLLAVFSTVIPSFMIAEAIRRIGPAQTGIIGTLGPIMTIFLAIWILHEPFTVYHAIGMILVTLGVTLLTFKKTKSKT
ncbi:DMT family transporter [Hydrogenovibrio kuenenii]|uniref:DMT family transporter n=1 Tax=Hydrogenovibrio kuenenii TaxID=63658 RepID=UPI0004B4B3A0|nr:DMT family transporter [Hydrogenovibrio kuenenii]